MAIEPPCKMTADLNRQQGRLREPYGNMIACPAICDLRQAWPRIPSYGQESLSRSLPSFFSSLPLFVAAYILDWNFWALFRIGHFPLNDITVTTR
jgi:hypothetical protein